LAFVRTPLLPILLALIALPVLGQNTDRTPTSDTILKTTSRAVVVDVLVTDNGAPVIGLTQKDFSVSEDDKPQTIDFFEQHSTANSQPAALPPLPPHVYSNQPPVASDDAVSVLLLDNLDTEQADQALTRQQVAGFVANLQPGTRVAIYTLNSRLQLLHGFTSDRNLLRAALDSKNAIPDKSVSLRSRTDVLEDKDSISMAGDPLAAQAEGRSIHEYWTMQKGEQATTVLTALQQLARALDAVPGRKNLVWFASKFPVALYPEGDNRRALAAFHGHELPQALSDTVNLLTAARIALYPVSARGLMDDRTTNADSGDSSMAWNPYQESPALRANTAMMDQLAANTGGHAIYTTNDLTGALTRNIRNGAQYYTLAYSPTNEKADGKFRRIEVKLVEGKYKLAYRRGYYANADPANAPETTTDPLAPLLANGLPDATQIVYRIHVTPEPQPPPGTARAGGNTKLAGPTSRFKIDFLIPTQSLTFTTSPAGSHDAKIRVAMVVYGNDGKPQNWTGGEMKLSLNDASYAKAQRTGIAAPMEIDLPQNDLSLVTGIWDTGSQRAGTLRITVNPATDTSVTSASR
jgi:VWFA-related protein